MAVLPASRACPAPVKSLACSAPPPWAERWGVQPAACLPLPAPEALNQRHACRFCRPQGLAARLELAHKEASDATALLAFSQSRAAMLEKAWESARLEAAVSAGGVVRPVFVSWQGRGRPAAAPASCPRERCGRRGRGRPRCRGPSACVPASLLPWCARQRHVIGGLSCAGRQCRPCRASSLLSRKFSS